MVTRRVPFQGKPFPLSESERNVEQVSAGQSHESMRQRFIFGRFPPSPSGSTASVARARLPPAHRSSSTAGEYALLSLPCIRAEKGFISLTNDGTFV
ncbi:hypothetical protein AVEN_254248-1 [Araneus ventricosus]|uniref:Uncharacterized protein n=1 Tax=Araneus ventricosus TaxID=182803 RepID=A0A4Y2M0Q2_ARAVE|nr:hypothetical protein AVEN_254248-1 [Araneus ventricosus]